MNTLEESAPETVRIHVQSCLVPDALAGGEIIQIVDRPKDVLPSLVLYASVLFFVAISAMNCFVTGTTRLMKSIVSRGRMALMMQPSILLTCFTLVACFAGHADASFNYTEGFCLTRGTGVSGCSASDLTAEVTNYTGPSNCTVGGDPITGTIKTRISPTASKRYDIGVYIGLNGSNAQSDLGTNACLVQTLGLIDAANNPNIVKNLDDDTCWDSEGEIFNFQIENFKIECNDNGPNGAVTISACFVYDNNANTQCPGNCIEVGGQLNCLVPGTPSVSCPPPHFSN